MEGQVFAVNQKTICETDGKYPATICSSLLLLLIYDIVILAAAEISCHFWFPTDSIIIYYVSSVLAHERNLNVFLSA